MSDLTDLAKQTLAMLDKQQEYFRCNERQNAEQKGRLLSESKRLERDLRKRCEAILNPDTPLSLFAVEPAPESRPAAKRPALVPAGADDDDTDPSAPWWNRH